MESIAFIKISTDRRLSLEAFATLVFLIEEHNGKMHLPTIDFDLSLNGRFRSIFECDKLAFHRGVKELIEAEILMKEDFDDRFGRYCIDENIFD
jgi:hypothetical protein